MKLIEAMIPIQSYFSRHSATMIAILASGGILIPDKWNRGSARENNAAQVSGSRSRALLNAFIEISMSLNAC